MNAAETNLKLYELLNKDFKMRGKKTKPKEHMKALFDFVLNVDQLTGCMLIMLLDTYTVSQMVCDSGEKKCDELLMHIVRKFTYVHKLDNVYKIIYIRYKDSLELLPHELQAQFKQCTSYHVNQGGC